MPTLEPQKHSKDSVSHFACTQAIRENGAGAECCACSNHDCPPSFTNISEVTRLKRRCNELMDSANAHGAKFYSYEEYEVE